MHKEEHLSHHKTHSEKLSCVIGESMKIILKHTNLNTLTTVCYMSDLFFQKATDQILWSMRAAFSVLPFESGQRADVKPHSSQTQHSLVLTVWNKMCTG